MFVKIKISSDETGLKFAVSKSDTAMNKYDVVGLLEKGKGLVRLQPGKESVNFAGGATKAEIEVTENEVVYAQEIFNGFDVVGFIGTVSQYCSQFLPVQPADEDIIVGQEYICGKVKND